MNKPLVIQKELPLFLVNTHKVQRKVIPLLVGMWGQGQVSRGSIPTAADYDWNDPRL
jgi:hypothetical protein